MADIEELARRVATLEDRTNLDDMLNAIGALFVEQTKQNGRLKDTATQTFAQLDRIEARAGHPHVHGPRQLRRR